MNRKQTKPKAHSEALLVESREHWWNEDYLDLLAGRLDLEHAMDLIDIGCGKGMMAFRLSKYLPEGARVWGIDQEEKYIKSARRYAAKKMGDRSVEFHFMRGDAYEIPLEDDSVDMSVCQTLLIHLESPLAAIREMKRITRPGGTVIAFEPNNLVGSLMFDHYRETDYAIADVMELVEMRLRIEKGKKLLGEGFSSLGDVLPDLFLKAGLSELKVWLSDKAMSIIPPYETREMRLRVTQLITWIEDGDAIFNYDENLRYYIAGGGAKDDFDMYWQRLQLYRMYLLEQLKTEQFVTAGGSIMYIVVGHVEA